MGIAPRKILVNQVNWLGDLVMSLPALRAVRKAYPEAHLAVLIKQELASFFDGATFIDEMIPYRVAAGVSGLRDKVRVIGEIRSRHFDLAVLFPNSLEAALWIVAAGIPNRAGFIRDGRGPLLTLKTRPSRSSLESHQVYYLLEMLRATLQIEGSADDFTLEIDPRNSKRVRNWLSSLVGESKQRLIAIAPAAAFGPAKEWPLERYAALVDLLRQKHGARSVLVGSPSELDKCQAVKAAAESDVIVAAGKTSIGEMAALLSLCDGFAGNDSGVMHVAAAIGIPTVGIFGSTDSKRTGPLGTHAAVIYRQIECSPCLKRTCRFGHYNCLRQISPNDVAESLAKMGAFSADRR
jgi:heptosyltransferase-2